LNAAGWAQNQGTADNYNLIPLCRSDPLHAECEVDAGALALARQDETWKKKPDGSSSGVLGTSIYKITPIPEAGAAAIGRKLQDKAHTSVNFFKCKAYALSAVINGKNNLSLHGRPSFL